MTSERFGDEVRVLLVEDEPADAERVVELLHSFGLEGVRHVQTAEEAVHAVLEDSPDLALVDLYLPGMSGVDLARRLCEMRRHPAIVLLTGSEDHRDVREAFRAGVEDYVCKAELTAPDVDRTLARVIARVLDARRKRMLGDEMMAVVAHDLLSPLANVVAYAQLLGDDDAPQRPAIRRILANAAYMRQLVEGMLALATLESSSAPHAQPPVSVRALLERAVDRNSLLASGKEIALVLEPAPSGPSPSVAALGVEQVVNNLIGNAIKFSPRGTRVTVGLAAAPAAARFWVQDEGPGIPAGEAAHLFERFARGTARPTAGEASFGLGLHIVHRIVALHGGTIDVASEPGNGSRFTVTLPEASGAR